MYVFFQAMRLLLYFSKPRGCYFIFLSLETVTCMYTSVYFLSLGLFMLVDRNSWVWEEDTLKCFVTASYSWRL